MWVKGNSERAREAVRNPNKNTLSSAGRLDGDIGLGDRVILRGPNKHQREPEEPGELSRVDEKAFTYAPSSQGWRNTC